MSGGDEWTVRRVLAWATEDLRGRGGETPRLDVELLLAHALGTNRIGLIVDPERPLSKTELAAYRELHKRRRGAEPVAYLIGSREFYGRPFQVDRRVLVPRPDTETLIEVALERAGRGALNRRVLDLCTGSGCVAITLALERPTWAVLGSDVSPDALEVARDNALRLGAVPRCWFVTSDLFEALGAERPFDLVVGNPPYIARDEPLPPTVRDHEPHLALFAGEDGLDTVRRIVADAPRSLVPGGVLALEVGAGQAPAVEALLVERGFTDVERRRDLGGIERVVSGISSTR